MKAKRKRHDNAFKARVALEALKGIKTIQAIGKEFDLHPMQVSEWKKSYRRACQVFLREAKREGKMTLRQNGRSCIPRLDS